MLTESDFTALWLTCRLATVVTFILLIIGTPLAWWLSRTRSMWRGPVSALVALPLVLPPTVLGFYLLIGMGPDGPLGQLLAVFGITSFTFSFGGLVFASVIYSLPFVVQPLHVAFSSLGDRPLEVAATLRAGPIDRFFTVVLPLSKAGFVNATILGFAHTIGEFGVVLMIGGNIPGETKVLSVQLYDHVESLAYAQAHSLAAIMLVFAFAVLMLVYTFGQKHVGFKVGAD